MTQTSHGDPVQRFKTHRRTITETDIVTFVNLVGLHEPFFIDMEHIQTNMTGAHRNRFAPGPMIISIGMGLLATYLTGIIERTLAGHAVGPFGGMTGLQVRLRGALFPGAQFMSKARPDCSRRPRAATR
jgi:acyl dehydratase